MSTRISVVKLRFELDVVGARQCARRIASLLGFDVQDQTRIATAVSEIARNAFLYAREGRVEFDLEGSTAPQVLSICIADHGPGIASLNEVLRGSYRSSTGMGMGIVGARRLMDNFTIESAPATGTTVLLKKLLPRRSRFFDSTALAAIQTQLAHQDARNPLEELRHQNQELLNTLGELSRRQEELSNLNSELEDTNRGVVALYAELDEKADHLRRADDLKSRFLSDMSHEFRTPVNSIRALSKLLLGRTDGDLTVEQERQVEFILRAADGLSELVNDLLDLAKMEAGRIEVHAAEFDLQSLFGALRGMLRPLLVSESVQLVFDTPIAIPTLNTDEGKVSQILRNFISNALKFTERGEVRVSAQLDSAREAVVFSVSDTGIGIAPEDQQAIFNEFTQLDSPLQRKVKGTGLGLPLTKRLAELLGGSVSVTSQPGVGSTFSAVIPVDFRQRAARGALEIPAGDPQQAPVLVIEDSFEDLVLYQSYLRRSQFCAVPARNAAEARLALQQVRPSAIILDINLVGEQSWDLLTELKRNSETRDIPLLVISAVEDRLKGLALGADVYAIKPVTRDWLLQTLLERTGRPPARRILIVDDEEVSRYLLKQMLKNHKYEIMESANGVEGLNRALREQPDLIFMDLVMPEMTGAEALRRLKDHSATSSIPVIMLTSKILTEPETQELSALAAAVLSKSMVSPEMLSRTIERALSARYRTEAA